MPDPSTETLHFESFAIELARAAGEAILPGFRTDVGHQNKAATGERYDPVTDADRAGEAAIRALISKHYPDHGVLGEEYGADRIEAEFVWVLDPIDGTRAFMAGLPLWTTLIALRHHGRPIVGLIGQPFLGEVFVGGARGSRLIDGRGERRLAVRPCASLDQAIIATTDQNLFEAAEAQGWNAVRAAARLARYGCDAYAYAMVALGRIDVVIESGLKPWDWEPLIKVVEGAGGCFTGWDGQAPSGNGRVVAAGDRRCLEEALGLLRR